MPTLKELIDKSHGGKKIFIGRVDTIKGGGKYGVDIGGKTFTAFSNNDLRKGERVVVADTETGKYIVGAGSSLSRKAKEVHING